MLQILPLLTLIVVHMWYEESTPKVSILHLHPLLVGVSYPYMFVIDSSQLQDTKLGSPMLMPLGREEIIAYDHTSHPSNIIT